MAKRRKITLRQNILYNLAVDIGQSPLQSVEPRQFSLAEWAKDHLLKCLAGFD